MTNKHISFTRSCKTCNHRSQCCIFTMASTKAKLFLVCKQSIPGVSKDFARRATCGEMRGCRPYSIHYESTHGPKDIIYMSLCGPVKNWTAGRIWPAGQTLDMPDLCFLQALKKGCRKLVLFQHQGAWLTDKIRIHCLTFKLLKDTPIALDVVG